MKTVLSIAGSDSSGGAGIQADIKTMTVHGVYAMSAVTALTAQNTTGVKSISEVTPDFLKEQIDAVFEDIYPDAVKIGMVSSEALIYVIAERLKFYDAKNIVIDPVMTATSGIHLLKTEAVSALCKKLLPLSDIATPNIGEAEALADIKITNKAEMEYAAKKIYTSFGCKVLLKGGHSAERADDVFYDGQNFTWFCGKRINNPNTHGTGCTLSSAVAANLAEGLSETESIKRAKEYVSGALYAMLSLGKGSGPINHVFVLSN